MAKKGRSFGENSRWNLGGMTALVTGGTKGIGEAVVEELAMFGAKVHTCARDEAQLQERLHEWQAKGFQVTTSVCDVSSRDQREKLMETVSSLFQGKLNILVNNAGTYIAKPTTEYTAQDFSFLMATNLESAFHLSQLAHPLLKASGSGSIVLMSSVSGFVHVNVGSVYGATKGAMNQLARNLACEWASDNIRTNAVCPWFTVTPLAITLLILLVKPFALMEVSLLMASPISHRLKTHVYVHVLTKYIMTQMRFALITVAAIVFLFLIRSRRNWTNIGTEVRLLTLTLPYGVIKGTSFVQSSSQKKPGIKFDKSGSHSSGLVGFGILFQRQNTLSSLGSPS